MSYYDDFAQSCVVCTTTEHIIICTSSTTGYCVRSYEYKELDIYIVRTPRIPDAQTFGLLDRMTGQTQYTHLHACVPTLPYPTVRQLVRHLIHFSRIESTFI
jgi:hypothetical protein